MEFQLERHRIDKLSRDALLSELEEVAAKLNFVEFGKRDFPKYGRFSAGPVVKEFGTWSAAMAVLRERLSKRGISLRKRVRGYTDAEIFSEMERIWRSLGHRPSRIEWEASNPRISYSGIKSHFGGWGVACLRFIEFKMGTSIEVSTPAVRSANSTARASRPIAAGSKRNIPLALRLKVLQRDQFRCVFCGRSPATIPGVSLHIDHRVAFSNRGPTTFENLQTLCAECNLGKGKRGVQHT